MGFKADKILKVVLLLVVLGLIFKRVYVNHRWPGELSAKEADVRDVQTELSLPGAFNLDVPFVCQAPLGNWDFPFDHACEEAAVLMAHYYFQKKTVEPTAAAKDIGKMVDFEKNTYGFHEDTSAEQIAQLIRDYYGYKVTVEHNISSEDIKRELIQGRPVIVPTAGRMLGNPYFTPPGPVYHMVLIKGYSSTDFIVHDPGTKRGADFSYAAAVLEKAICDWDGENVLQHEKVMIVIYPPK